MKRSATSALRLPFLLVALFVGGCTLATYERDFPHLGHGVSPAIEVAPSTPVAVLDLEDAREEREYIASARTAREWRFSNDQDIAAWVTEGLRRGLSGAGVRVGATPAVGATVVSGRVIEVMSEVQGNLSGSNRLEAKVVVAFSIERGDELTLLELEGKHQEWAVTEPKPALEAGLESALADLAAKLSAQLAEGERER